MTYLEALAFLDSLDMFRIKLGLETMHSLLDALDHPERRFPCIHIAGTNGKGSVGATLKTLLAAGGLRAGFYSSPHLETVRERFVVNDELISETDFAAQMTALRPVFARTGLTPTWFECATLLAFRWFAAQNVDVAVLETGLGGRLDATNVVLPLVSVITDISRDHEQYLGTDIESIAAEKAGIVKPGVPVVFSGRTEGAAAVVQDFCDRLESPLFLLGRDFFAEGENGRLTYTGIRGETWRDLPLALTGNHQLVNAALALAALEATAERLLLPLNEALVRRALPQVRWPGRLEFVEYAGRRLLLDGAHNEAGVSALADSLATLAPKRRLVLLWGNMADKHLGESRNRLFALADRIILTRAEDRRSARPEDLLAQLNETERAKCRCLEPVDAALAAAGAETDADDLICAAGSLYLVGRIKQLLNREEQP